MDEALSTVVFLASLIIELTPGLGWLLAGRIVAQINQSKAVGYSFRIIEMKQCNCRAATCGNAFNQCDIEAKMAMPSLLTWIEEEDDFV
jgi:hypothetical protein